MRARRGRAAYLIVVALMVAGLLPAGAGAAFHLTNVREVFPGTTGSADSAFVELQAYASSQNFLAGHWVRTYDATGAQLHEFTIPTNAAQGGNQRTFLIADQSPPGGVSGDWTDAALGTTILPAGGAVCFDSLPVDCASWGNFTGAAMLPGASGTPAAAAGIPDGSSLTRSIAPGCPTLLEAGDDSADSSADFTVTAPSPRPNSVTPTEQTCAPPEPPNTSIDSGPKKKTKSKRAKLTFSSATAGATFQCSLDGKPFSGCSSPLSLKRIKKGKHELEVRAVDGSGLRDPSPASYRWKRVKTKKR